MRSHLLLASLLGLLLPACAPVAMLRPPVPMAEGRVNEVGLGVGYLLGVDPPLDGVEDWGPTAQASYTYHFSPRFQGGVVASTGAAGVHLRYLPVVRERVRFGLDLSGGLIWAELNAPFSVRLGDRLWLYSAPGVGLRNVQAIRLPVGLSVEARDRLFLTAEIAAGIGAIEGQGMTDRHVYGALGATFQL